MYYTTVCDFVTGDFKIMFTFSCLNCLSLFHSNSNPVLFLRVFLNCDKISG